MRNSHCSVIETGHKFTHPPLKAPTGLRIGNGVATSAALRDEVWKDRAKRREESGELTTRKVGWRTREAIVVIFDEVERCGESIIGYGTFEGSEVYGVRCGELGSCDSVDLAESLLSRDESSARF